MNESLFCEPSLLESLSGNVGRAVGRLSQHLESVNQLNGDIKSAWDGDDITKYTEAVAKQAEALGEVRDAINDLAKFMLETAQAYAAAEKANADGINL